MSNQAELSQAIATVERQISEAKSEVAKKSLNAKLERLKEELKTGAKKGTSTLATLSSARKSVRKLASKDFTALIEKLSAKPEYAFLKGYSKDKLKDDIARVAKPVGYRFVGDNTKKPTISQIKKGLKDGTVYYEARPIRSDVSRVVQLGEGGSVSTETIDLKFYGSSGKVIESGKVIIDYDNETITLPSGKTYKVESDSEYAYKFLKTKMKAARGIKGLSEFLKYINEPDSGSNSRVLVFIDSDKTKMSEGGTVEDCIDYIKNSESIKNNGYYLHINSLNKYVDSGAKIPQIKPFCLITFNSGGQKNLKAIDTINATLLSSEIAKLLNIDIELARIIVSEQTTRSKRFTMDMLDKIKNNNIIVADRETIVCTNLSNKFAEGGNIESSIDKLYEKAGFMNDDMNWQFKLLEMLQDGSSEAHDIYQGLSADQKEEVLQELYDMDNDMGSYGEGDMETSRENLEIMLHDAESGHKYAKGGGVSKRKTKGDIGKSGTQYGYTLKEYEEMAEKNGLLVSPSQFWKSQDGKKYTDSFGRTQTTGERDKQQVMMGYGYRMAILLDLGSKKVPASAKKYVEENNLSKFAESGGVEDFIIVDSYWSNKKDEIRSEKAFAEYIKNNPIKNVWIGLKKIDNYKFDVDEDTQRMIMKYALKKGASLKYYVSFLNHSVALKNNNAVFLQDKNYEDYDNKILTKETLELLNTRQYAEGGTIDNSYLGRTQIGKSFYGWKATTSTTKKIKGYDWEITTMKRYGGELVSTATGGKSMKQDGYSTFEYSPFEDPNYSLVRSKPKMVNEKAVTKQHEEALKIFIEKMNEMSGEIITKGGGIEAPKYFKNGGQTYTWLNVTKMKSLIRFNNKKEAQEAKKILNNLNDEFTYHLVEEGDKFVIYRDFSKDEFLLNIINSIGTDAEWVNVSSMKKEGSFESETEARKKFESLSENGSKTYYLLTDGRKNTFYVYSDSNKSDKLVKEIMATGGLIVNNDKDLKEVAEYMTTAVKKHRWDLKDLIYYFEKENGYDYTHRVKIWEDMNGYEMKKTYENIYEMLKRIVEANGKKMKHGGSVKAPIKVKKRLEAIRKSIQNENVSYGEMAELQSLSKYIDPSDVELREAAGMPEFDDDDEMKYGGKTKSQSTKSIYIETIAGKTGLRTEAIETFVSENNLSDKELLNLVQGIGTRKLESNDLISAVVGIKGNKKISKVVAFAKSDKAFSKMAAGGTLEDNLLPPSKTYGENIAKAMEKFDISSNEARKKYGQYTIKQWAELLGEKMGNGGEVGDISKSEIPRMQKITKLKGLYGYMPSINVVYYDSKSDKFYFQDFEGDYMEVRNISTLEQLDKFLKENNITLDKKMATGGGVKASEFETKGNTIYINGTKADVKKMYLDYVNNFLTIGSFADHYGISDKQASLIIENGREYAKKDGYYATGGSIPDNYEGRTSEDIWNNLSIKQKAHFLFDHVSEIEAYKNIDRLPTSEIRKAGHSEWSTLDRDIKNRFTNHTREGQYATGGYVGGKKYSYLPNEDISKIVLKSKQVIGEDRILDGAYIKSSKPAKKANDPEMERAMAQLDKLKNEGKLIRYLDVRGTGKKTFDILIPNKEEKGYWKRYESTSRGSLGTLQNEMLSEEDVLNYILKTQPKSSKSKTKELYKKFDAEKQTIALGMIAQGVAEDFMRDKFDKTMDWEKLSDKEKEEYNKEYKSKLEDFTDYLLAEFLELYYGKESIREKCKGTSRKTIDTIESVLRNIAKEYPEEKYATGGGVDTDLHGKFGDDNPRLVNFDIDDLDQYEEMVYNDMKKSNTKAATLQVIINTVEGDYTQLSPELAEIAEEQFTSDEWDEESNRRYFAKGGGVSPYYGGMSEAEILKATVVYDNGGETLDRYTVFTPDSSVFGMSATGDGFNQYIGDDTEIEKGSHLGKRLKTVPKDIKSAVLNRMKEEFGDGGSMYKKGGNTNEDLSGNYFSSTDFVETHNLKGLAKETFGDNWESGGDYDFDEEEIRLLIKKLGGGYKVIFVDSEDRDAFEEAKANYFPKIKNKSNDGDLFVIPTTPKFKKGGNTGYAYVPNADIEKIVGKDGKEYGQKMLLDGAYVKDKVRTPKMSRTQFEDDVYAYGEGGEIERNKKNNDWNSMFNFYTKYNSTPVTKGNLIKMAYKDVNGVDSAIPQSIANDVDDTFYYVYDYQEKSFGELVDLRKKLKFSNNKVDVTIAIDGDVIHGKNLPAELEDATFHQALAYVFKHDEVEAFDIRPKTKMAKGGGIKDENGFNLYEKLDDTIKKDFSVYEYNKPSDVIEDNSDREMERGYTEKGIVDYEIARMQRGYIYAFHIQGVKRDNFNFVSGTWEDAWEKYDNDDYDDIDDEETEEYATGGAIEVRKMKKEKEKMVSELFEKCGVFFAFSEKQFEESKTPLKEGEKYVSIGGGGYLPKGKVKELEEGMEAIERFGKQTVKKKNLVEAEILDELQNHECFYTGDISDVVDLFEGTYTKQQIRDVYNKHREANQEYALGGEITAEERDQALKNSPKLNF